jgi:hypothetical protein
MVVSKYPQERADEKIISFFLQESVEKSAG